MRALRPFLAAALAALVLGAPARADQILGPGRIDSSNRVVLPGGPALGTWQAGKYTAKPDSLQILGSGSTGDVSGMSAKPTGAVMARSLDARFGEVVNAADYGVACDGTTDMAAKLAAAIAAAVPRPVYIPPQAGACLLSSAVSLKTGLVLYAQRGTVTLKPTAGSTASPLLLSGSVVGSIVIDGLGFDGGGQDFTSAENLLVLYRVTGARITNTDWANTRGSAIVGSNTAQLGIAGNGFTNIGNHWRTTGATSDRKAAIVLCCNDAQASSGNVVRNNTFTDVGLDAISATEQTSFTVDGNACTWSSKQSSLITATDYPACVYVANATGAKVTANISAQAPGNGVDLYNVKQFVISGNVSDLSGAAGIAVDGGTGSVTGNTVTNGIQWSGNVGKGGISLFNSQNVSVTGNTSTDTQATKTQPYGVWGATGGSYSRTGAIIDQSNVFSGNATGALGGGITAYGVQP